MVVLGLTDLDDGDWARLRGLQYSSLAKATLARLLAHAIAGLATAGLFLGTVHIVGLVAWLGVLAAALYFGTQHDNSLADADRRRLTHDEVNKQTIGSVAIALAWVVPIVAFNFSADSETQLKLWSILAMLMTTSAIVLPAVPMGTLMFAGIAGGMATLNFAFHGAFDMAIVGLAFCATIIAGTIESARNYLTTKVAEAGMAEKSEVVSLLLREFEEGEADWLWQIDPSRRVRSVSPRFAFALGMDAAEIDGKPFIQLIAGPAWETGEFPSSLHDLAERLKRRESFSNLLVRVTLGGSQRWWELSGTPKLDDKGVFDGFRGVGSDVTEQRDSSDKIAHMARYDTLTGLPNRMMLTEALGEAMRYSEQWRTRCAFLMIDLDRFKAVNDTLGHLIGDQLLARVSERLKEGLSDNELCRPSRRRRICHRGARCFRHGRRQARCRARDRAAVAALYNRPPHVVRWRQHRFCLRAARWIDGRDADAKCRPRAVPIQG